MHGGNIIGMHVETDPIDPKAIDLNALAFGPTDLTDYSGVEVKWK